MKKDYVYQDKGQFKLLQNATRIGGFVAGDQGIVPSERVLPEQRLAHQPIFRRPQEEQVTVFSYIYAQVANLFKKSSTTNPDGIRLLYKYTGWADAPYLRNILIKNWSAEAQATHHVGGGPDYGWFPNEGMWFVAEEYPLITSMSPIFFKDYVFFWAPYSFTDAIYYAKLNTKKTETKEIKVAIHDHEKAFYSLGWLYVDNSDPDYGYKITIYKQDSGIFGIPWNPYSENLVQYKANNLEGPWVYDKTWDTYYLEWGNWNDGSAGWVSYAAIIQELASLILSKTHKNLSIAVVHPSWIGDVVQNALTEAYDPPFYLNFHGADILSRGEEGEIVRMWEGGSTPKNYLIKRQGNGQMKKTLITDIDYGYFD